MSRAQPPIRSSFGLALLVLVLVAGGCTPKVPVQEWEQEWSTLLGQIPSLEIVLTATEAEQVDLCEATLGTLRAAGVELMNAPEADLEQAALHYVVFAEAVFFECPLRSGDHAGFEAGYEEMRRLETAVEAILGFDE